MQNHNSKLVQLMDLDMKCKKSRIELQEYLEDMNLLRPESGTKGGKEFEKAFTFARLRATEAAVKYNQAHEAYQAVSEIEVEAEP